MNIFGCALQYCYIKFMLNVTKVWKLLKTTIKSIKNYKKNYNKSQQLNLFKS